MLPIRPGQLNCNRWVEEMCKNILQHGSADPGKHNTGKQPSVIKNAISVRCLIDQDQTIRISIRDDCKPFSPVEWKDIHQTDEDPTTNIGIRLTSGISQEMRYVNVMNMNSLYITIQRKQKTPAMSNTKVVNSGEQKEMA